MRKVAIVGTGISGLACAHRLHPQCELTLYEREDYVGGHTNTVTVREIDREVPIDTGFMVYNEVTYPRLTALFEELQVPTQEADMSFGMNHLPARLTWCSHQLQGIFAQKRNVARPQFWLMIRDFYKFNRIINRLARLDALPDQTLGEFLEQHCFSEPFARLYLLPMCGAIWSTPQDHIRAFPLPSLARFLYNHGLLGRVTHHTWRTVTGGSRVYRERLIEPFRERIHTALPAVEVQRRASGAVVVDAKGEKQAFDSVIIATHADEALQLLANPTRDEHQVLGAFAYNRSHVQLHTDARVMPGPRSAWAAWNYRVEAVGHDAVTASTHYWMNRLQGVSDRQQYFVSLDAQHVVDPQTVLWEKEYTHPRFDLPAVKAQAHLPRLNETGPIYFAGAYFRYGFHEDGLMSGENVAQALNAMEKASIVA
ncbi:MAG: FAD-dependent oxidoreductase [Verrucomicrobiota bacterium JB022]|nr:FAD-dependent oxidoreductase [Verrucomicrobiota bacterium JB022]